MTMIPDPVIEVVKTAHNHGQSIVLVTGVFDILHREHEIFLKKAKEVGEVLIIGIESDARVRTLKGEGRPVNSATQRLATLEALAIADAVFVLPEQFNQPTHRRQLLMEIKPDVLAVSSHTDHLEAKRQLMAEIGGVVKIVHQHNPEISTTKLLSDQQLA